jgi:decaprenylphospho-beta-D-ribofuranose 2-oxidase
MGLTGLVLEARLRLQPVETAWLSTRTIRAGDLDELLAAMEEHDAAHPYSVAWLDTAARGARLGRGILMLGRHATVAELHVQHRPRDRPLAVDRLRTSRIPATAPRNLLRRRLGRLFNHLYYLRHRDGTGISHYGRFFFPLDGIAHWNRLYGRAGFSQYQFVVPMARAREVLIAVLEEIAAAGYVSCLSVLKRMGPAGDSLLGFPMPGYTLTLDLPVQPGLADLFASLDDRVAAAGGRVYLTKDAWLTPDAFRAMYHAGYREWLGHKRHVDPHGRFSSGLSRRLRIEEDL